MRKLLLDLKPEDALNMLYGLNVLQNLGATKKAIQELMSVILTIPEETDNFICCEVNMLLSPHFQQRDKMIEYYRNSLDNALVKPVRKNVDQFVKRSRMSIDRIVGIDAPIKDGEVFLVAFVD